MQRCLFNLHRRLLPIDVTRSKAQEYVDAALVDQQSAHAMVRVIELERGGESVFIERHGVETEGEGGGAAGEGDQIATKLNMRQLAELLADRERLMRQGSEAGQPTDQWRVFVDGSAVSMRAHKAKHIQARLQRDCGSLSVTKAASNDGSSECGNRTYFCRLCAR